MHAAVPKFFGGIAMLFKAALVDSKTFGRTLTRISHEIIEKNEETESLCLIGIKTRGIPLAKRIAECIHGFENKTVEVGTLDITMYRDDLSYAGGGEPVLNAAELPFDVNGKTVILVDDVIYTGRTARAAMDAVMSCGRPAKIQLAVFVDRGHRELPIRPDYVGKNIPTSKNEIVRLCIAEIDGADKVELYSAD